ncbi:MAG: ATP-binding protein [Candidatus Cloacimonetes bacterium]|nr:ATP-binding protein [Candidatus Cloacimonadota bacterium]MDD4223044.1 ATP-binding protein [Candidatus Cloacimonadota bacterium]
MIIYFSVQNFRSLRDKVTLDFRATSHSELSEYYVQKFPELKLKLLKLAMIFGKNASGKTNILRALDFLRSFMLSDKADKDKPTGVQPFALDQDKDSEFEIKFVYDNIIYRYKLRMNQSEIVTEQLHFWPKGKITKVFTRELLRNDDTIEYKYDWLGAKASSILTGRLELTVANQSVLTQLKQFHYTGPMQKAYDWFYNTLAPIVYPNTDLFSWNLQKFLSNKGSSDFKDFYVSQLQTADFMIKDITVNKEEVVLSELQNSRQLKLLIDSIRDANGKVPSKIDRIDVLLSHQVSDGEYTLALEEQSAGTIRYLELCGFLCWLQQTNKIIPIDEIERAMHEDLIKHFIATYLTYAKESQLIVTSQNSSILNMKDIIRRDTIWITDRLENGGTELTRLTEYPVKMEHSIGNLFRKGLIGGKPNIGDVLVDGENES